MAVGILLVVHVHNLGHVNTLTHFCHSSTFR